MTSIRTSGATAKGWIDEWITNLEGRQKRGIPARSDDIGFRHEAHEGGKPNDPPAGGEQNVTFALVCLLSGTATLIQNPKTGSSDRVHFSCPI